MINKDFQEKMLSSFWIQKNIKEEAILSSNTSIKNTIGIENEYLIIDEKGCLVSSDIRDKIISYTNYTQPELGQSQIEFCSEPFEVSRNWKEIVNTLLKHEDEINNVAARFNCRLVRIGCYPGDIKDIKICSSPQKNNIILDNFKKSKSSFIKSVKNNFLDDAHLLLAGCQSSQLNIRIPYDQSAIKLLNITYETAPYFMTLSTNSSIIDNCNSNYEEIRPVLWEVGYDCRSFDDFLSNESSRCSLPKKYYEDLQDYWRDVASQTFMYNNPEEAFLTSQKMFWKIARIKFYGNDPICLLELRYMAIQDSMEKDILIHLFTYYYLLWRSDNSRNVVDLLPMSFLKENHRRACKNGIRSILYLKLNGDIVELSAKEILKILLNNIKPFIIESLDNAIVFINLLEKLFDDKYISSFELNNLKKIKILNNFNTNEVVYC